jgi:D-threonate/D-erythronate kinase
MFAIVADDLTGAAEVAGVCLRYGLTVAFGVESLPTEDADVRVIATDSRSMSLQEAVSLHQRLAILLKEAGIKELFKKTDSVLRGHVLAEMDALMSVYRMEIAVLQPANPEAGRCIRDGRYLIDGIPLSETGFAGDPDFPATTSSVKEWLWKNAGKCLRPIHNQSEALAEGGIYIPDAYTALDLKGAVQTERDKCLFAGSAAFLGAYLEETRGCVAQKQFVQNDFPNAYLMVCGSKHPRSEAFLKAIGEEGASVAVFPDALLKETLVPGELESWSDGLAEIYSRKQRLHLTQGQRSVTFPGASFVLKNRLADVTSRLLEACSVKEVLIEGGATAFAILQKQGWKNLMPVEEWAPGIVRMRVKGHAGLYLTLKPGSYYWPQEKKNV